MGRYDSGMHLLDSSSPQNKKACIQQCARPAAVNSGSALVVFPDSPGFKSSGLNVTNPVSWWKIHWKREAGREILCIYSMDILKVQNGLFMSSIRKDGMGSHHLDKQVWLFLLVLHAHDGLLYMHVRGRPNSKQEVWQDIILAMRNIQYVLGVDSRNGKPY